MCIRRVYGMSLRYTWDKLVAGLEVCRAISFICARDQVFGVSEKKINGWVAIV